ncbi:MAG: hypothetical protein PHI79_04590 [Sulfurovaceae bacterium]|nr:hypothetical protein [Sulfurovaceae bacterium]MDD5548862.1 hypothetical protein [Sulfurovaceae bacterium]
MAKDPTIKLRIRAFFESHSVTYKELHEHFKDMEVSQKTMEYWGREEQWEKGKYKNLDVAIDAIFAAEMTNNIEGQAKKLVKQLAIGVCKDKGAEEYFVNEITKELLFAAVNKNFLAKEMVENLADAKRIATISRMIGVKKTYHDMLTSTYTTLHGRQTNIGLINPKVVDDQTLEQISTEELMEIIEADDQQ